MVRFLKKLFCQSADIDRLVVIEETDLSNRITQAKKNLEHAWQNFAYAQPEYIDIAIMEIHNAENEFNLLTRKLRLLQSPGEGHNQRMFSDNPRDKFSWLQHSQEIQLG